MPEPEHSSTPEEFEELDQLCDRFEDGWQTEATPPPRIEDFLSLAPATTRREAFGTLLELDLDYRKRTGQRLSLLEYTERFPEFSEIVEDEFASPEHLSAGDVLNGYEILETVGNGSTACVYRAHDPTLDCQVAIKLYREQRPREAHDVPLMEPRMAAQLDHPNIVRIYTADRLRNGRLMIVSQFISGTTLRQKLEQLREHPTQVARIISKVAGALHSAHRKAIFHRDVSPSNILLNQEHEPFLTDFGLAAVAGQSGQGHIVGTPGYMSPEQARGEAHLVDERSDVFSLCAVFYEAVTGKQPFRGKTPDETIELVSRATSVTEPRRIAPDVPVELDRIIAKGLNPSAHLRYQRANELQEAIDAWLDDPQLATTKRGGPSVPIKPHGLSCFDEADAGFFLRLIPGPRAQHDLPESILFWRDRLESRGEARAFPIGLMVGPSGSGKSSFLRAGLIPLLRGVHCCVVSAKAAGTELALAESLRQRFPGLARNTCSLTEMVQQIRGGHWLDGHQKLLIVIDQFEQYLTGGHDYQTAELIRALRQCDGNHTQALLLVRGDHWDDLTECLRALGVSVTQENYRPTDAFTPEHARQVLLEFGRAYGCLTESEDDNQMFADRVVTDLAARGTLLPVHIAFFCRAFHDQPWTIERLQFAGGVGGVLDEFPNRVVVSEPLLRQRQDETVRLLQSLVPEADPHSPRGTRTTKTTRELSEATGIDLDLCAELMEVLAGTPFVSVESDPDSEQGFQLAHDYLVNVLRDWTDRRLGATWSGRAERLLRDRTESWVRREEARALPSVLEWVLIWVRGRRRPWNEQNWRMMRKASGRYLFRLVAAVVVIVCLSLLIVSQSRQGRAASVIKQLESANTSEVSKIVEQGRPIVEIAVPKISRRIAELDNAPVSASSARQRLNFRLAQLAFGDQQAASRIAELAGIIPGASVDFFPNPADLKYVLEIAGDDLLRDAARIKEVLADDTTAPHVRLRAAAALATFARTSVQLGSDPLKASNDNEHVGSPVPVGPLLKTGSEFLDWLTPSVRAKLVNDIVSAPPLQLQSWIELLHPIGSSLQPELLRELQESEPVTEKNSAAAYAAYASEAQLCEALPKAKPAQLPILIAALDSEVALLRLQQAFGKPSAELRSVQHECDLEVAVQLLHPMQGVAGPAGAVVHAVPGDELDATVGAMAAAGYQLDSLRPYINEGRIDCAATWVVSDKETYFDIDLAPQQLRLLHETNTANSMEIVDVSVYRSPAGPHRFCAVWRACDAPPRTQLCLDMDADDYVGLELELLSNELCAVRCAMTIDSSGQRRVTAVWKAVPIVAPHNRAVLVQLGAVNHFPGYLLNDCQLAEHTMPTVSPQEYLDNAFGTTEVEARKFFERLLTIDELEQLSDHPDFGQLLAEKAPGYSAMAWGDTEDRRASLVVAGSAFEHLERAQAKLDQGCVPASISLSPRENSEPTIASVWHSLVESDINRSDAASRRANIALACLLLGDGEPLREVLSDTFTDKREAASYVLGRLRAAGVSTTSLLTLVRSGDGDAFNFGLLLALAELEDENQDDLAGFLRDVPQAHPAVRSALEYCARKRSLSPPRETAIEPIGCTMIRITAPASGMFRIGGAAWQQQYASSTAMQLRPIPYDYELSATELTITQFRRFITSKKVQQYYEREKRSLVAQRATSGLCPQYKIAYLDALLFCQWLSEEEGIPVAEQCYAGIWDVRANEYVMPADLLRRTGYRLPTEAEWEYACRAGSATSRHFGSDPALLPKYAWGAKTSNDTVHPVGQLRPNEFGFFDMMGNVAEWCHETRVNVADDWRRSEHLTLGPTNKRIYRGGHYRASRELASAPRPSTSETFRSPQMGLRIARTVKD